MPTQTATADVLRFNDLVDHGVNVIRVTDAARGASGAGGALVPEVSTSYAHLLGSPTIARPAASHLGLLVDVGVACVMVAAVMGVSTWLYQWLGDRASDAAKPAARQRQSGRADMGLLLRIAMLLCLGLMWCGGGMAFISVTGLTDLIPTWQKAALLAVFVVSYMLAALTLLVLVARSERQRAELEKRLGGAWVVAMARKVRS